MSCTVEHLKSAKNIGSEEYPVYEQAVCADGFKVSIQASRTHYSTPRITTDEFSRYSSFELGFPSEMDELLAPYAEEKGTTKTIFGYVPVKIVDTLIKKHGGLA